MKPLYAIILIACAGCLCSCGGKKNDPQSLIVAKWTLQQEHVVVTYDNATYMDTVLKAGGATHGVALFNSDGSYSSSSVYYTGSTGSLQGLPPSDQNNTGTYSYSGSKFKIIPGLAGWYSFISGSSTPPVTNSSATQITSLTQSALTVHTDLNYTITNNTGAHTIDQACDLYYTR